MHQGDLHATAQAPRFRPTLPRAGAKCHGEEVIAKAHEQAIDVALLETSFNHLAKMLAAGEVVTRSQVEACLVLLSWGLTS